MITPGVPSWGGVTTINGRMVSGVGVKVGAGGRVGTGVSVGRDNRSEAEQPNVTSNKTAKANSKK